RRSGGAEDEGGDEGERAHGGEARPFRTLSQGRGSPRRAARVSSRARIRDSQVERRLAAILAADVVGFSALMERDEAGAFARLKACQAELFEPAVQAR